MLLPIKWLDEYCKVSDIDRVEFAGRLTDSGTHIEEIIDNNIEGLVVGQVVEVGPHPDADKLQVTKVDIGTEILDIVCGAPNVAKGQKVPVATIGSVLPGDFKIKKAKVRGVESNGMICSLDELGFSPSVIPTKYRDGIYVYSDEVEVGSDGAVALGIDLPILECEITPNRPDCLSIVGLARETSATFDRELTLSTEKESDGVDSIEEYFNGISVDTSQCKRFYSKVLKDVKIEESPQWLQNALMSVGIRPINNIVDLSNYVMLEYGQPTHAYDLDHLGAREIKVYRGLEGEKFVTLDGEERILTDEDIVIGDGDGPIGIAGVMGGLDSEITDDTKVVVLEGANFDKSSVRATSKRLGLRTEASSRFEKGIDPKLAKLAVDRIAQLAEEIGAATVVNGSIDVYNEPVEELEVSLRVDRCNRDLGTDISPDKMVEYLDRLFLSPVLEDRVITCTIPTFRGDISIEEDLVEEVGRLYGYNNIEPAPIVGEMTRGSLPEFRVIQRELKDSLRGMGYNELLTYSFISPSTFDKLGLPEDDLRRNVVELINPLGEEFSVMRTTMMGNTLEVLSRNQNRSVDHMLCYEIGNIFSSERSEGLPTQSKVLNMAGYGEDVDFYFVKDSLVKSMKYLGIKGLRFEREEDNGLFHPGRCANVLVDGQLLGVLGEVHPDIMKNYGLKDRVILGEFDFDLIVEMYESEVEYQELPKYPASERDLAVVLSDDVLVSEIEDISRRLGRGLLEDFRVFDIYTGSQVPEGKKSVAFNLVFRDHNKTLKDEEVNSITESIVKALEDEIDGVLRD